MVYLSTAAITLSIGSLFGQVSPVLNMAPVSQSRETMNLVGSVHTMRQSTAIVSSPLDLPARFAKPHVERVVRFDGQGRLAMSTNYTFNKVDDSYVYGYDDQGRMIEYLSFTQEDTPPKRAEFLYDRQGRLTRQVYTDVEGRRQTRLTQYSSTGDTTMVLMRGPNEDVAIAKRIMPDEEDGWRVMSFTSDADQPVLIKAERLNQNGQVLASVWYDASQQITGRSQASYDEQGRLLTEQALDGSDNLLRSETWTYDQAGLPQTHHLDDGSRVSHTTYKYDYDKVGNWVLRTASSQITDKANASAQPGHEEIITFREFEYAQDRP